MLYFNKMLLLIVLALLVLTTHLSAETKAGKELYVSKFCITCHGPRGIAIAPNYPNLAGQNEIYIGNQIRDIISGKRKNNLTVLMTENPVVTAITEDEILAVAKYLAGLKRK